MIHLPFSGWLKDMWNPRKKMRSVGKCICNRKSDSKVVLIKLKPLKTRSSAVFFGSSPSLIRYSDTSPFCGVFYPHASHWGHSCPAPSDGYAAWSSSCPGAQGALFTEKMAWSTWFLFGTLDSDPYLTILLALGVCDFLAGLRCKNGYNPRKLGNLRWK